MNIQFNPFKVISQNKIEEICESHSLNLGKISQLDKSLFNKIINIWINQIDTYLSKVRLYSDFHIKLFRERFVSFEEFKYLFTTIEEKDFKHLPAIEYFMITDDIQLNLFKINKSPTYDSYYNTFLDEIRHENIEGLNVLLTQINATLKTDNLKTHIYITGKTGSGKSELLKLLFTRITQQTKDCLILIEPHGDTCKSFAQIVQKEQPERLLYFDPFLYADEEMFPVINPFFAEGKSIQEIDLLAKNLTAVFQELLPNELSTNMKAVLEPCISVLLQREDSSLVDLQRLVKGDKDLLAEVKSNAKHHKLFFDNFKDSSYTQTKSAIFTKIQSLLNSRVFYNCVTGKNTIDLEQAIKDRKIIVCNLNKGLFGEEHAQAFGKLLIAQIKNFAFKQAEHERQQIYLAVDECHNFISNSMETILTEARKYKLSLILSNQMSKQLGSIEETTLSNVGAFFVGNSNSKDTLQKISGVTDIPFQSLKSTPKYHFWFSNDDNSFQFKVSDEFLNSLNNFEEIQKNSEFNYNKLKKVLLNIADKEKPKFKL